VFDPLTLVPSILGTAGSVVGKVVGDSQKAEADKKALEMMLRAAQNFEYLPIPENENITPEQYAGTLLSGEGPQAPDKTKQLELLRALEKEYATGGMTKADDAALTKIQNESARNLSSRMGQLRNNLSSRGMSNSGMDAMLALQAAQNYNSSANEASNSYMADARMRALRALESSAAGNENMMNMDYRTSSDKTRSAADRARAQDAINMANSGMRYQAQLANNQARQQKFANQLQLANARAGALEGNAGMTQNIGAGQQQSAYDWGSFANNAGNALTNAYVMAQREPAQQQLQPIINTMYDTTPAGRRR